MKQFRNDARRLVAVVCLILFALCAAATAQVDAEQIRLFPLDPQRGALFGYSVGVARDTMVVGAFLADTAVPSSGAAYVFQKFGGRWIQTAELSPSDAQPNSWFGSSSAINATGDVIVVGAPQVADASGQNVGAAYVFRKVGSQWFQEAKLTAPDLTETAEFGGDQGVAISGNTIVVGAGLNHNSDSRSPLGTFGAAYVFQRTVSGWQQTAKLTNPEGEAFSFFGSAVAVSGNTVSVGSPGATVGGNSFAGAIFVYDQVNGAWSNSAKLSSTDATSGTLFVGDSLAMSGDTIVAGTEFGANAAGDLTGAAYVFRRSKIGGWLQEAKLLPSDGLAGDSFGDRIAVANGTVLVGADFHPNASGELVGSAYAYQRVKGAWTQVMEMLPPDGQAFGEFGCSIATDGRTLVVGAGKQGVSAGPFSGEAYVYPFE